MRARAFVCLQALAVLEEALKLGVLEAAAYLKQVGGVGPGSGLPTEMRILSMAAN
jgi:hypothetical protein